MNVTNQGRPEKQSAQKRTVQDLNDLKNELEQLIGSLRNVTDPKSRFKIMDDFKKGLAEFRKGIFNL